MLTLVINSDGTSRIVTLAEVPSRFGVEPRGPGFRRELTPEEKRLRKLARRKERRRLQEQREAER